MRLEQTQVDVVLLDLLMPKMNGIQVLEALQAQITSLAVIVLTTFVRTVS